MPQKTVVERAASGEDEAWTELTKTYDGLLRKVAGGLRLAPCDAEDATQMTWLALFESLPTVREPDSLGAWLAVVMRRRGLALLRARRQEGPAYDPDVWDAVVAPDRTGRPEIPPELADRLWRLVDDLPPRERAVVRALFDGTARSYRQLATELDMPIGAIGPTRMRALRKLAAQVSAPPLSGVGPVGTIPPHRVGPAGERGGIMSGDDDDNSHAN